MTSSAKRAIGRVGLVVTIVSVAVLVWSAQGGTRGPKPVPPHPPDRGRVWSQAAEKAFGRRVLVIAAKGGAPRTGGILESERAPEGWSLFSATPTGADLLERTLFDLAQRAAETFDETRRRCDDDVESALDLFAVKTVVFDRVDANAGAWIVDRPHAEPVLRLADGPVPPGLVSSHDAVALAASLATSEAMFLDWEDALWGGDLVVEVHAPARYVFPFPHEGATVTVDGRSVASEEIERAGPLVVLNLPAGRPRVVVSFDEGAGRAWLPIAAAAGVVLGVIAFLLAVRPTAAEIEASAS